MKEKLISLADAIIKYGILTLVFLTPLFFLPITAEFFQLNKIFLFVFVTAFMMVFWTVKMVVEKKVLLTKTSAHLPLLLLLASIIVSTIFSQTPFSSVYGNYGRFQPNLVSTISYLIFFFMVVTNIKSVDDVKSILRVWVIGLSVSALFGLVVYLNLLTKIPGLPLWLTIRNLTTTGSPLTLSMLTALSIPLTLALIKESRFYLVSSALFYLTTVFIGSTPSIIALVLGLLITFFLMPKGALKVSKAVILSFIGILAVLTIINFLPTTKELLKLGVNYQKDVRLDAGTSWVVSTRVLSDSIRTALIGTGPGTFLTNFTRFKPLAFNTSPFWNLRFDRPISEYLLYLATTGLLGLFAYGLFAYSSAKAAFKIQKVSVDQLLSATLAASVVTLLVSQLFIVSTVSLSLFLFVMLAGLFALEKLSDKSDVLAEDVVLSLSALREKLGLKKAGESLELLPWIFVIVSLVLTGLTYYYGGKAYYADVLFRKSINTDPANGIQIYDLQRRAINLNPYVDLYRRQYAQTNFALANAIAANPELTDQDRADIQQLIAQAIRETRVVTERLNPFNVANWESRARIYGGLTNVAANADRWAIDAYNNAILLDPTNPNLRIGIGGIYFSIRDFARASAHFADAVRLKNDHANAHYNLAAALRESGDIANAVTEMEIVLRLIPVDSPDYETASKELSDLREKLKAAGEEAPGPSVEQLESEASDTQEQLTPPGTRGTELEEGVINLDEQQATPSITPSGE